MDVDTLEASEYQVPEPLPSAGEYFWRVRTYSDDDGNGVREADGGPIYTFASAGMEGNDGDPGATPTAAAQEPVTYISWRDAMLWCNALSEIDGKTPIYYTDSAFESPIRSVTDGALDLVSGTQDNPYVNPDAVGYRLPWEIEWEIAARGTQYMQTGYCTVYSGSDTIDEVCWYFGNSGEVTHDVASLSENEFGLFDMSGNVWEWCWDWWADSFPQSGPDYQGPITGAGRVVRGGGWGNSADMTTVGYRYYMSPQFGIEYLEHIGIRPVLQR